MVEDPEYTEPVVTTIPSQTTVITGRITIPVTTTTAVTTTLPDTSEQQPEGDANGDTIINVRDCAFIASALAAGTNDKLAKSADFNGDGVVNVRDAAAIANYLATAK